MSKGRESKISFCHTRAWELPLSQRWLVFVLFGVDATPSDGCEIWEHLHSLRKVKCLQGYSKALLVGISNLKTPPLVVEHSVVVLSARLNPMDSQFSIPILWNLCSQSVKWGRGIKFWDPFENSQFNCR